MKNYTEITLEFIEQKIKMCNFGDKVSIKELSPGYYEIIAGDVIIHTGKGFVDQLERQLRLNNLNIEPQQPTE